MAGQEELTLLEFQKKFSSEEECREHLFSINGQPGTSVRNADIRNMDM